MKHRVCAALLLLAFAAPAPLPAGAAPVGASRAAAPQPAFRDALLRLAREAHDPLTADEPARFKALLARYGWPTVPAAGRDGVDAAGEPALRSTADDRFQGALEEAMAGRIGIDVDVRAFARLNDRIEVAHGRPPQFGALLALKHGKVGTEPPVVDAQVNPFRDAIGLPPLAEELARVQRKVDAGLAWRKAWPTLRLSTPFHPVRLPALADELHAMAAADQQARNALIQAGGKEDSPACRHVLDVDAHDLPRRRAILDRHGFPDAALVGRAGVKAFWLLVQHAVNDKPLMYRAVRLGRPLMLRGDLPRGEYALLVDRTRLMRGRKQLYGSQLAGEPGRMTVQPLEDPAHVDPRRAAMGLLPLADYLRITNDYYANKNASSGPAPASSSPHS